MKRLSDFLGFIVLILIVKGCTTPGTGLFAKKTPHEIYGKKLIDAGLENTSLGKKWFSAADSGMRSPLNINIPYSERGYFEADSPDALGLRFPVKRGEKLAIELLKNPESGFMIFLELWEIRENNSSPVLLMAADSNQNILEYEVDNTGKYLLRLQPELLKSGEYTLKITSGPSLAYPIKAPGKNHIKSFWGAARDGGARSHEGIDLFAARNTPVVAAASGRVSRVNENRLGGKVVWMQPANKNLSLYYAHLDSQLVVEGQQVNIGDTLGLMGNTGNARTTSPHLHFGIYARGGAVDPFPFVNPDIKQPGVIPEKSTLFSPENNQFAVRNRVKSKIYLAPDTKSNSIEELVSGTLLNIQAISADWYRVKLPDERTGFVRSRDLSSASDPLQAINLKTSTALYSLPDSLSPKKNILNTDKTVNVLGKYNNYFYVDSESAKGWILK